MELDNESKYLELTMDPFPETTLDSFADPAYSSTIPPASVINAMIESVNRLLEIAEARGIACDRGMRELSKQRKDQVEIEAREFEGRERALSDEMRRNGSSGKIKKKSGKRDEEERPLTHGAHGLAPQDGSNLGKFTLFCAADAAIRPNTPQCSSILATARALSQIWRARIM